MLIRQLKYFMAGLVNSHPYIWLLAWRIIPYLTFLLPHDKSYYAFKHLASGHEGLFLDVGANNGISAMGFRRINSSYKIFSIEANRYHEPSLMRLKTKLTAFDYLIAGAGHENSQITLYTPIYKGIALHTTASLSVAYIQSALERVFPKYVVKDITCDEQLVNVIRLDDLDLHPDIVKIDAEGFDYQVLLGLKQTIIRYRPYILVEFSPSLIDKLDATCIELSYFLFVYNPYRDHFVPFDQKRELHAHHGGGSPVNLFLIPSEKVSGLPIMTIDRCAEERPYNR